MITVEFEFETEYGTFRDAILYPDDVYYTEEELDMMKQERLNNWLAIVSAPIPEAPAPDLGDLNG